MDTHKRRSDAALTLALISLLLLALITLPGCQTTMDPNYSLQIEAYRLTIQSQREVDVAKSQAEAARYAAIADIASRGDLVSRQTAIIALALSGKDGVLARPEAVVLPRIPENQEDRALKWAAIFAGPTIAIAQGYFGYRLGVTQSNNTANSTIASYNALGITAVAGINATAGIANTAFTTLPALKPGVPNVTINGNGVVGSGSYVGDNSGDGSANSGIIRIASPDKTITTRTCTSGSGGDGTPGNGAASGGANC
jgi:hypothetical protein